jgi:hypothetical protein
MKSGDFAQQSANFINEHFVEQAYYIAWPNIDKIYLTSLEMEQKLKLPY